MAGRHSLSCITLLMLTFLELLYEAKLLVLWLKLKCSFVEHHTSNKQHDDSLYITFKEPVVQRL